MSYWDWEEEEGFFEKRLAELDRTMATVTSNLKRTGLVYDDRMAKHYCQWNDEYTEKPERLLQCYQRCQEYGLVERCHNIEARFATEAEMMLLHTEELVDRLKTTAKMSLEEMKSLSTKYDYIYFHKDAFDSARLALGSAIELVDNVLLKRVKNGMALVRPPGHHAMREKFCGYCYLNNVATAAQFALENYSLQRILIVDWDVHHGQGTQYMFYDDPRVLYFSIHRHEHGAEWPNLDEADYSYIGEGKGKGFNVNVPLNTQGCEDKDYMAIILQVLLPIAYQFRPELVLVSAGYDAALGCPEGEMQISPSYFAHIVSLLSCLAEGKLCLVLEGGYCLKSLSEGVALSLKALLGDSCPSVGPLGAPTDSVRESILNTVKAVRPYWTSLCYQGTLEPGQTPEFPSLLGWPTKLSVNRGNCVEYSLEEDCYNTSHENIIANYVNKLDWLIENTRIRHTPNRVCLAYNERLLEHIHPVDGVIVGIPVPKDKMHGCQFTFVLHKRPNSAFCKLNRRNAPECPGRLTTIYTKLEKWKLLERCHLIEGRSAIEEDLFLVHSETHVNCMKKLSEFDDEEAIQKYPTTFNSVFLCKETYSVACQAVGSLLSVIDHVMEDQATSGVAVIRPPGHHAEYNIPMGFCIFNNVSIAARYAQGKHGVKRVLILDWDVHHGNGTQHLFYQDNRVLYLSIHRFDDGMFFPLGSDGGWTRVGEGDGRGYNVNIPWRQGRMGDAEYMAAFQQVILPITYEFNPELVIVSAGFDASREDYLGGYKVNPQCFAHMTRLLMGLANGRIVLALEGGYNQEATAASLALCTSVLLGDSCPSLPEEDAVPCPSAMETITTVLNIQKEHWKSLCFRVDLPDVDCVKTLEKTDSSEETVTTKIRE